jgi:hypothetical protein
MTNVVEWLFFIGVILSSLGLGVGFWAANVLGLTIAVLVGGIFWVLSHWRRWTWGNDMSFVLFSLFLALGAWLEMNLPWMLAGITGMLAAWDMNDWIQRLKCVERIVEAQEQTRQHILRLGAVLILGLGLTVMAVTLRLTFSFGWALILGFVMMIALSRVIGYLQKR